MRLETFGDVRAMVGRNCGWSPRLTTNQLEKVNEAIDAVLRSLSGRVGFSSATKHLRIHTDAVITNNSATDTLQTTADPFVVVRATTTDTSILWATDGSVDGRLLRIVDPSSDFDFIDFRIREVWTETSGSDHTQYISLMRPWSDLLTASTEYTWQIEQDRIPLPLDFLRVRTARIEGHYGGAPLAYRDHETMVDRYRQDLDNHTASAPRYFSHDQSVRMPRPTQAPSAAVGASVWGGSELRGDFQYAYTLCWGYLGPQNRLHGPSSSSAYGTRRIPTYESALSDPCARVTQDSSGNAIDVTGMINYEYMAGFWDGGSPTPLRAGHSGWFKRIYRRRLATRGTGSLGAITQQHSNKWYPIADIDASTESWTDNGTAIPDMLNPYQEHTVVRTINLWPMPSQRVLLSLHYTAALDLNDDEEAVPLASPLAIQVLAEMATARVKLSQAKYNEARQWREEADRTLHTIAQGEGAPQSENQLVDVASASDGVPSYKHERIIHTETP